MYIFPMKEPRGVRFVALMATLWSALACSKDPDPAGPPEGSAADAGPDTGGGAEAGGTEGGIAAGTGLTGSLKDQAGFPVGNAEIRVGSASTFSDTQGKYTLAGLPPGTAMVEVKRNWFKTFEGSVTVGASGLTSHDLTLEEMPLRIEAADRALAETYGRTFDWTKQTLSIAVVARPSRRDFDNAVYYRNPALYRDPTGMAAVSPTPAPEIAANVARNFTFPLTSGARRGQEALDLASIADTLGGTPLGATEPADFMIWTPMVNWLSESDPGKTAELKLVEVAVRQQAWGSNALRPQEIEKVYLDAAGALWVKVVFAPFVQLGPGVADDDGDGLKEIYARVNAESSPAELTAKLKADYGKSIPSTHALSLEVARSLNELYSRTAAQVERYIGQPFEAPGVGTIMYPFVVLRHSAGQKNVILVAPSP
jgi:hypothetical protein